MPVLLEKKQGGTVEARSARCPCGCSGQKTRDASDTGARDKLATHCQAGHGLAAGFLAAGLARGAARFRARKNRAISRDASGPLAWANEPPGLPPDQAWPLPWTIHSSSSGASLPKP